MEPPTATEATTYPASFSSILTCAAGRSRKSWALSNRSAGGRKRRGCLGPQRGGTPGMLRRPRETTAEGCSERRLARGERGSDGCGGASAAEGVPRAPRNRRGVAGGEAGLRGCSGLFHSGGGEEDMILKMSRLFLVRIFRLAFSKRGIVFRKKCSTVTNNRFFPE